MANDMVNLIENENADSKQKENSVVLVGHSMGGRTCMFTALARPDLVDALVVVDVSPINQKFNLEDGMEWHMDHFFHAMKAVKFIQPSDTDSWSLHKSRKDADVQLSHRIRDANLRAWLLMNMGQDTNTGLVGWRNNLEVIHESFRKDVAVFPNEQFLEKGVTFSKKTLFIGGAESEYIPVSHHEDIMELFPTAKFEYIEGAGHWVHSQKPAAFLDVLVKFLSKTL